MRQPKEHFLFPNDHPPCDRKVGDGVRVYAGAPGTGYTQYRITRIDPSGVYGVPVFSNVRELDPSEVV